MAITTTSNAKTKKNKGKNWDVYAVGRRKSSVARIFASVGKGEIVVNNSNLKEYFPLATSRYIINQPLGLLRLNDKYNIKVNVRGGGPTGQAGAIRLGIARVLIKFDPSLRAELKKAGFLTRDSRKVERKKPGRAGARKKFQFSKR